jgi:glycosyltransferase involved in cell wall biosynthesis
MKRYQERDSRITIVALEKNSGRAAARNAGIEKAASRYIAFLDSDDLWHPQKLEKHIAFMVENGYALSYTHYRYINPEGVEMDKVVSPPSKLDYKEMLKSNQIGCLTAIYDSGILGKQYMSLTYREDYYLWLKILKMVPSAYCLPEVLSYYRTTGTVNPRIKWKMVRHNFHLYHRVENLSALESCYYVGCNIYRKLFK